MSKRLRKIASEAMQANWFKILSLGEMREGCTFLDLGCGEGKRSLEFAHKIGASKIYGVDISETKLSEARKKGMIAIKADINRKLPFEDCFFDAILCNQVAEHLINPDNLFEETHRILKRNGYVIISVPNLSSLHNRMLLLFGFHPTSITPSTRFAFGNPDRGREIPPFERHVTAFSPRALREMLSFYGFKVEKIYGSGFYPFGMKVSKTLSKIFPNLSVFLIAKITKR